MRRTDTTLAYANPASAAAQLRVARSIVSLLDDSLRLTRLRHGAGLTDGLVVARIEGLRDQRAAAIPTLEAERSAALFALATLTGRTPAELPEIAGERTVALEISAPLPVGDGSALLARRPRGGIQGAGRYRQNRRDPSGPVSANNPWRIDLVDRSERR